MEKGKKPNVKRIYMKELICEWKIRAWMYFNGLRISLKNPGIIQWNDGCHILRPGWQDKFTIEEMEEFGKELKR